MDYPPTTLLKRRRTKIVATIGPASQDPAILRKLMDAGVNVFRINMSHGEHPEHEVAYQRVRAAAMERSAPIAVLADLCGPKMRVGRFPQGPIQLEAGCRMTITTRDVPG